jgi:Ion transport protein
MGRALDMIRVMRFFEIFRDVVRRSSDVLPAMVGPITLVTTMLHFFVYVGMALWGGAIDVGELTEDQITPYYDLNNFNSYLEGLITMFQIMVVNDWHAIAEVFLYAKRCSSPSIVYPFFVIGNLVGVSILLNVVTAFFVEGELSTCLLGNVRSLIGLTNASCLPCG